VWHPAVMPTYRVRDTSNDTVLATADHEDISTAEAWAAGVVEGLDPAPVTWVLDRE
jgi:hypothetical protein